MRLQPSINRRNSTLSYAGIGQTLDLVCFACNFAMLDLDESDRNKLYKQLDGLPTTGPNPTATLPSTSRPLASSGSAPQPVRQSRSGTRRQPLWRRGTRTRRTASRSKDTASEGALESQEQSTAPTWRTGVRGMGRWGVEVWRSSRRMRRLQGGGGRQVGWCAV